MSEKEKKYQDSLEVFVLEKGYTKELIALKKASGIFKMEDDKVIDTEQKPEKRWSMGMSNEQFDSYKSAQLMLLEDAKEEIDEKKTSAKLERLIAQLKKELQKP